MFYIFVVWGYHRNFWWQNLTLYPGFILALSRKQDLSIKELGAFRTTHTCISGHFERSCWYRCVKESRTTQGELLPMTVLTTKVQRAQDKVLSLSWRYLRLWLALFPSSCYREEPCNKAISHVASSLVRAKNGEAPGTHCLHMRLISTRCGDSGLFLDSSVSCDVRVRTWYSKPVRVI